MRDEEYFTTLLRQNSGWQNGLKSRMLLRELYKIMVDIFTFVGFRGVIAQSPPWIRPCPEFMIGQTLSNVFIFALHIYHFHLMLQIFRVMNTSIMGQGRNEVR